MFSSFIRPTNLSKKVSGVIFSIYLGVTCLITGAQFYAEYLITQSSILSELKQVEATVIAPMSSNLWQYNLNQLDVLSAGLLEMPIIEGVDIVDANGKLIMSKRSYAAASIPLSIFDARTDLKWVLNDKEIYLGSLTLYSSSEIVLDRVIYGFSLIAIAAVIKLFILFSLFIWAFDRYLAIPLKEFMSQVNKVQADKRMNKRIHLSTVDNNELTQLQSHMNSMLCAMQKDRQRLLEDEQAKRNWLEEAVAKRTEALQVLNEKLENLAKRDSLTGILNRGGFFDSAQNLLILCARQNSSASLILMDLDHFKLVNDTYGHFIGDKVLQYFTQTIRSFLRESDIFGRLGGEEFAIFLSGADINEASKLAVKLRKAISESTLELDGKTITYTVSIGVESSNPNDHSIDDLFKRADIKLYGAKDKGRDRVER